MVGLMAPFIFLSIGVKIWPLISVNFLLMLRGPLNYKYMYLVNFVMFAL